MVVPVTWPLVLTLGAGAGGGGGGACGASAFFAACLASCWRTGCGGATFAAFAGGGEVIAIVGLNGMVSVNVHCTPSVQNGGAKRHPRQLPSHNLMQVNVGRVL